ncbi:hypothetical protein LEJE111609_09985 [Lelliottia jeotgali]
MILAMAAAWAACSPMAPARQYGSSGTANAAVFVSDTTDVPTLSITGNHPVAMGAVGNTVLFYVTTTGKGRQGIKINDVCSSIECGLQPNWQLYVVCTDSCVEENGYTTGIDAGAKKFAIEARDPYYTITPGNYNIKLDTAWIY